MSVKFIVACAAAFAMAACSDNPEAPVVEKGRQSPFPPAMQNPATLANTPMLTSGPRVEVYSNGILKQVFSTAGSSENALPAVAASLPEDFGEMLAQLARNPLNARTRHFAELMQTVARAPEAGRAQAIEVVSRQLLRETEHKDTTLADGTRILEYYFDHQLATRVVLAPARAVAGRPVVPVNGAVPTPFGATTISGAEDCGDACYDISPEEDAALWATLSWYSDQTQAMVDYTNAETDSNGLVLVVYAKSCYSEIYSWAMSVGTLGYSIGKLSEGWKLASTVTKQGGVLAVSGLFGAAIHSWNNMHNCFHPN